MAAYHLASPRDASDASDDASAGAGFEHVVGRSPPLRRAVEAARELAGRPGHPVLLVGESGTGKDLFARSIHYAAPDFESPFVGIDCPNVPPSLLESELFGRENTPATESTRPKPGLVEVAGKGTLFLDEVGDLPLELQPKLLRALEEGRVRRVGGVAEVTVRCRIVAASSRPLEDAVEDGTFREDLYYRLNVARLDLPPLREREGDVELLARHFLDALSMETGAPAKELDPEALAALRRHRWPGNVRELKHAIRRAAAFASGPEIRPEHVVVHEREPVRVDSASGSVAGRITIPPEGRTLEEIEAEALVLTLRLTGGNKSAAARVLGCSRPTINRKIERFDLRPDEWEEHE